MTTSELIKNTSYIYHSDGAKTLKYRPHIYKQSETRQNSINARNKTPTHRIILVRQIKTSHLAIKQNKTNTKSNQQKQSRNYREKRTLPQNQNGKNLDS